jgi:GNAT superfamily N-acetyltransferase
MSASAAPRRESPATRRTTDDDLPALAQMLARAFFDDPVAIWTCRSERLRPRVLGTDPSAQGQGLGSAVLHPVLEQCDADGVGAYLESSKERNIGFYARHGFRVTAELRMPRGPKLWAMWREPRG